MPSETTPSPVAPVGIDLDNWRHAPYNEWAFQNVDQLIASARIATAGTTPEPWREAFRSFSNFQMVDGKHGPLDLQQFLRVTQTDGFLVVHNNQIAYEFYEHGMDRSTAHIVMSASKSIVGLIAGIAQARGMLQTEALVSDFVPEIADTAYRQATIRHLLDMRTGVQFASAGLAAYNAATGWDPVLAARQEKPGTTDSSQLARPPVTGLHDFFERNTALFQPHGGPFRYLSPNTDLLGWVLERAAAQPFNQLASDLLWQPMGAERPASITLDWDGAPRCTGGLSTTLRDLARIGWLMLRGGRCGQTQVVPESWLDDIEQSGDHEAWRTGEFAKAFGNRSMRYRNGWYVNDRHPRMIFAMGVHGQHLFVDRDRGLVIAKLSSQATALDTHATGLTLRAVAAIGQCLTEA